MLRAKKLTKSYGDLPILKGIDIDVKEGEIVAIVGSSGAGKSTLLHILGTLEKPDTGELWIQNQAAFNLSSNKLSAFRNQHIGFIFQFHHLLPEFSALENVMMPALIKKDNKKIAMQKAENLLEKMQLQHRLHHKPAQLSGGEQQRVAIARALINNPSIVLADEPTGNLDTENANLIFNLILQLRKEIAQTFILVTHNESIAKQCDRTYTIQDGKTI